MNHLKQIAAKILGRIHIYTVFNRNMRTLTSRKKNVLYLESKLPGNRKTIFVTVRNYTLEGREGDSEGDFGDRKVDKLEKLGSYYEKHFFMRKQREDLENMKKNMRKEQKSPAPSQKEEK
ncbi:hypothetical protein EVAR_44883_1 [Eumeta japonica]|uniref:Uncharacterized protein n=1 Tax=Eumeta variegata TaxID=151549 RepID=A0A4C1Y8K7_EUMVA|nr:hypothetical protein EVAR_44883_1 [Eumeta japonica]